MSLFSYQSIFNFDDSEPFFECDMVRACPELFGQMYSNYEVEEVLVDNNIVNDEDCDSETCALVVNFKTVESGRKFIDKLNKFISYNLKIRSDARQFARNPT